MRFAAKQDPERVTVQVAGLDTDILVRRHARARRIILKVDPATGGAILTLPEGTPLETGRDFAQRQGDWLQSRLDLLPAAVPFAPDAIIPFKGEPHRIVHRPGRGLVQVRDGGDILVPGPADHLPRRLRDWMKRQARAALGDPVKRFVAQIGDRPYRLRVGDARSRWGSCSARGTLTFSWRLILAPQPVLVYLAAHEVAHLEEMNHGPRFWALVAQLDPDHKDARKWLKNHGPVLHAVGRTG